MRLNRRRMESQQQARDSQHLEAAPDNTLQSSPPSMATSVRPIALLDKSPLLRLPVELRLEIYSWLFAEINTIHDLQCVPHQNSFGVPLLNVCRQIRREGLEQHATCLKKLRAAAAEARGVRIASHKQLFNSLGLSLENSRRNSYRSAMISVHERWLATKKKIDAEFGKINAEVEKIGAESHMHAQEHDYQ